MRRLYLLVEGQTEETFVRELLVPHYARLGLFMTPILFSTSLSFRGGITSYGKVKAQIVRLCRQDRDAAVTTLIDLYGLPKDFPGKALADYSSLRSGIEKAKFLEGQMAMDINEPNLIPYFMVHEFEALLFTDPKKFGQWVDSEDIVAALTSMIGGFETPEDINEDPRSAPSKRILSAMPSYEKTFHGPLIAIDIGLDRIRKSCAHFAEWLNRLELLGKNSH